MLPFALFVLSVLELISGQDCVRANSDGGDSLPSFSDPEWDGPHIRVNPIQVIIPSYRFHCCGKVGGWAAFVEPGRNKYRNEVYSVNFQIWRPVGGSDSTSYVKIGENAFPALTLREASRIEQELPNNEQLDFQPGDVVGYYLEDNRNQSGGVQFDTSFNQEELWYATGNSALQNECRLEVGSTGDLSLSTSLGPIISISLTTTVNDNCPSTFTSTMFCPTPIITSTPTPIPTPTPTPTPIPIPTPTPIPMPGPVETAVSVPSSSYLMSSTLLITTTVDLMQSSHMLSHHVSTITRPSVSPLKTVDLMQSSRILSHYVSTITKLSLSPLKTELLSTAVVDQQNHFLSSSVSATPRDNITAPIETNNESITLSAVIFASLALVVLFIMLLIVIIGAGIVLKKAKKSHKGFTRINSGAAVKTGGEQTTTVHTQPPVGTVVSDLNDYDYPDSVGFISSSMIKIETYDVISHLVYGNTSLVGGNTEAMVHSTQDGSDPAMRTNTAYGKLTEPQIREETYVYVHNPDSAICDPPTARNPAYDDIATPTGGDQNYYVNEGLDGAAEVLYDPPTARNPAYGDITTTAGNDQNYYVNERLDGAAEVLYDPPTAGNPAHDDITNTAGGDQNYYVNKGLDWASEVRMTKNEAYTGVRQLIPDNDPSITTKENEAYNLTIRL